MSLLKVANGSQRSDASHKKYSKEAFFSFLFLFFLRKKVNHGEFKEIVLSDSF